MKLPSLVSVLLVCLCTSLPARAQTPERMPTDTELHAIACVPLVQWGLKFLTGVITEADKLLADNAALPPEKQVPVSEYGQRQRQEAEQLLAQEKSTLARLRAYLLPRIQSLDMMAVLAADQRGKADVQEIESFDAACAACSTSPDRQACSETACKRPPVQDRLMSCQNPTWLPF